MRSGPAGLCSLGRRWAGLGQASPAASPPWAAAASLQPYVVRTRRVPVLRTSVCCSGPRLQLHLRGVSFQRRSLRGLGAGIQRGGGGGGGGLCGRLCPACCGRGGRCLCEQRAAQTWSAKGRPGRCAPYLCSCPPGGKGHTGSLRRRQRPWTDHRQQESGRAEGDPTPADPSPPSASEPRPRLRLS